MSKCVIKDCTEDANHPIHNPATGQNAVICDTHVVFIEGYQPDESNEEE